MKRALLLVDVFQAFDHEDAGAPAGVVPRPPRRARTGALEVFFRPRRGHPRLLRRPTAIDARDLFYHHSLPPSPFPPSPPPPPRSSLLIYLDLRGDRARRRVRVGRRALERLALQYLEQVAGARSTASAGLDERGDPRGEAAGDAPWYPVERRRGARAGGDEPGLDEDRGDVGLVEPGQVAAADEAAVACSGRPDDCRLDRPRRREARCRDVVRPSRPAGRDRASRRRSTTVSSSRRRGS